MDIDLIGGPDDDRPLRVLLVEDDAAFAHGAAAALSGWSHADFLVDCVATLTEAASRLDRQSPDAVVLALDLEGRASLEHLLRMRALAPRSAVIALSGVDDERLARDVIRAGAQDFVAKSERRLDRLPRLVAWACDRQRRLIDILDQALRDELTGLSNRRGLYNLVDHLMALHRRAGLDLTVVYLDLDGFKEVNDALGHDAGDAVLRRFAQLLRAGYRESDVIARVGGDEFVVVLIDDERTDPTDRLRDVFGQACAEGVFPDQLGFSVGVARSGQGPPVAFTDLLRAADEDMYREKAARARAAGVDPGS